MKPDRHTIFPYSRSIKQAISHRCLSILLTSLLSLGILGVVALPSSAADETLNNASVIKLHGLDLGDAVIIEKIKTSKCNFDTSVAGLEQLKAAKVSNPVIAAMFATKTPAPTPGSSALAVAGDPNDPATPHTAGVWVLQEIDGKKKMIQVESELSAATSDGGYIGPFGTGQRTQEARLNKAQSDIRLSERQPVFYFYLGAVPQGGNPEFVNAQSPNDFVLVRLTTKTQNGRELKVGSYGAFGGSSGIAPEEIRAFMAEKLAEGVFKIVPKANLSSGEYAFCRITQRPERFATFGIRLVNDPEIEKLVVSLNAKEPNVIIDALKKLRGMAGPETVPQILLCLKHRHENVIRDACRTLAVVGNKDIIPSIEPLLKHSNRAIKKDAEDAIAILRNKS